MIEKNVPEIRFKGFTDDWEERKLGDVAPLRGGYAFKSEHYSTSGIPVVRISNILSSGSVGDEFVYYQQQVNDEIYTLHDGDAVLAMSGATTGKVSIIHADGGAKYYQNQRVGYFTKTNEADYQFISTMVMSDKFTEQLSSVLVAGAQPNVSSKDIDSFSFMFPSTIDEQHKIGSFFESLNKAITLHQRKHKKLLAVKKSMLEKMFPQNGAKAPEIRFEGFTGDWEQRKLSDVAESFEYGLNAAAKEYDGSHKYIRITDIDDSSHEFLQSDLTSPDTNINLADNYKLCCGDILFARTGASVGKTYIYRPSDGLVYYAGFLIRAKIKKDYDAEFIFQNTLTDDYDKYIRVTSQRSGQPGVNAQEYSEYEIMVPSFREQNKISLFLRSLDNLITLHHREIDKLINIKKSLLEKMFP